LWEALIPVVVLIAFLSVNIAVYDQLPHIPLVLGTFVAGLVALRLGYRWEAIEEGMVNGISIALKAILILLVIGALIGTWIAAGVVPLMIFYGLNVLSPDFFLVAACLICAVVSFSTGSSWTTAGTVGVALMGVGGGLGISPPMVAGAVISGAYFGDKMSPLSDTTNLAPAVAGSEIFEHIRHMAYTTVPALILALILYGILGFSNGGGSLDDGNVGLLLDTLGTSYNLTPLLLLPVALVLLLVVRKVPALPALFAGAVLGGIVGMIWQDLSMGDIFAVALEGYVSETGTEAVDRLLSRGGMLGMSATIALILCAMAFGGVMERAGMLQVIAAGILSLARGTGSLVATTVVTCIGMNIIAPDQYLSIIVPGRMYGGAFQSARLHPKNLSRILEDAGTLSSPLVAWNTCGAFMAGALGISPFAYLPFAFLNLLTPVISVIYGFTGFTIEPIDADGDTAGPGET
jgi:NhaC family Na+:H+ antiporter